MVETYGKEEVLTALAELAARKDDDGCVSSGRGARFAARAEMPPPRTRRALELVARARTDAVAARSRRGEGRGDAERRPGRRVRKERAARLKEERERRYGDESRRSPAGALRHDRISASDRGVEATPEPPPREPGRPSPWRSRASRGDEIGRTEPTTTRMTTTRRTARSHRGSRIRCSRRCSRGTPRARRPSSGRLGASSWTASRDSPSRTEVTRSPCFCRHETRPRRDDGARQSGVRFCPTPFEHVKRFFMTRDVPTRSNIFNTPRRTTLLEEGTFYFLTFWHDQHTS